MLEDDFKTKIIVEEAKYDEETKVAMIVVRLAITGEKKILAVPKSSFHRGGGLAGDFPDKYMYEYVEKMNKLKGKTINWFMSSDPMAQNAGPEDAEKISKRMGVQMEELQEAYFEKTKVQKIRDQEEVRSRLRREVREDLRREGKLED